jgi:hypothetical protein
VQIRASAVFEIITGVPESAWPRERCTLILLHLRIAVILIIIIHMIASSLVRDMISSAPAPKGDLCLRLKSRRLVWGLPATRASAGIMRNEMLH